MVQLAPKYREAYIRPVLALNPLKGRLIYSRHKLQKDNIPNIVNGIKSAVHLFVPLEAGAYSVLVYVDGLTKTEARRVSNGLQDADIRVGNVQGVKNEDNDILIRLVDSVCGFVRAGIENKKPFAAMLEDAKNKGIVREV